jgi:uncharacterized protein (TIGR03435 family)
MADILLAVANSLWVAALLAGLTGLMLAGLAKSRVTINAATRHWIWWAVLAVVLILPAMPRHVSLRRIHSNLQPVTPAILSPAFPDPPALLVVPAERAPRWPLWVAAIWALLLLYRLQQIFRSYFYLRGVKSRGQLSALPLPAAVRSARLLISREAPAPMAVGFLRPAVILPAGLFDQLTEPELDHVLLHETAHITRYDDWTNLAVRLVDGIFGLHPVALWILRRIEREREIACDDWVLSATGAARPYAASLARLFDLLCSRRGELLASGIFGGSSRLGDRIEMILRRSHSFSARVSWARIAACVLALLAFALAASRAPRFIALAQSADRPSFEVAAVKPGDPKDPRFGIIMRPGGRFITTNANLHQLIGFAYDLRSNQITGGPGWVDSALYSIEANGESNVPLPPGPAGAARIRLMLQSLLADRFHLVVHQETRQESIYQLVVAKGGSKLKEADGNHNPSERVGRGTITGTSAPISLLIRPLSQQLGRNIVDETGLTGAYDFTVQWTLEPGQLRGPGDPPPPLNPPPPDPEGTNIFTALQEQLGLKLEAGKGTVDFLVIDRAAPPSEN